MTARKPQLLSSKAQEMNKSVSALLGACKNDTPKPGTRTLRLVAVKKSLKKHDRR